MPRIPVRYLSVLTLLPLLLFSQAAEAARISFATKDCGTPPLLEVEFTIDLQGEPVLSSTADACPDAFGVPGDLYDEENSTPYYGSEVSTVELTISSTQSLTESDFFVGNAYDELDLNSLGFTLTFSPFNSGGGLLRIDFLDPIVVCTTTAAALICEDLDLLIFTDDNEGVGLAQGSIVRVTSVNGISVPEPGTLALFGVALTAAMVRRRRTTAKA